MGIEYVAPWAGSLAEEGRFSYNIDRGENVYDIGGADTMVRLLSRAESRAIGDSGFYLNWQDSLGVALNDSAGVVLVAPVASLIANIESHPYHEVNAMPADVMRVTAENERARLTVFFQTLYGTTREGVRTITHMNADCFVTIK